jgi:hypothetical protein
VPSSSTAACLDLAAVASSAPTSVASISLALRPHPWVPP